MRNRSFPVDYLERKLFYLTRISHFSVDARLYPNVGFRISPESIIKGMSRKRFTRKKFMPPALLLLLAVPLILAGARKATGPASSADQAKNDKSSIIAAFGKTKYSLTDPASVWVVVNKKRALPSNYVPAQLVTPNIPLTGAAGSDNMRVSSVISSPLEQLVAGAKQAGYSLVLVSGYRSYATQTAVYNGYVSRDGQAIAETYSARPGHSEHQTGLAVDLGRADSKCQLDECLGDTPEGQWLAKHAYEYGFIIRYPKGKEHLTGYSYEPWHIRYVGSELSNELRAKGIETMEEFFDLPPAISY